MKTAAIRLVNRIDRISSLKEIFAEIKFESRSVAESLLWKSRLLRKFEGLFFGTQSFSLLFGASVCVASFKKWVGKSFEAHLT